MEVCEFDRLLNEIERETQQAQAVMRAAQFNIEVLTPVGHLLGAELRKRAV